MATPTTAIQWGLNHMKRLAFALVGTASLLLAGCNRSNEDQVQNAEINQPTPEDLNEAANQAAMDAANAAAATNAMINTNASDENDAAPTDADEQNVSGM